MSRVRETYAAARMWRAAIACAVLVPFAFATACGGQGSSSSSGGASGGASAPATSTGGTGGSAAPGGPSTPATTWRWLKGDLHVHTLHSGDAHDSVAQTLAMCRHQGLDFVALTDHDTLTQAQDPDAVSTPDLAVVIGCEWTHATHAGLIGARTLPPPLTPNQPAQWAHEAQAALDHARAEGAASILYHPTWHLFPWVFPVRDADAVEIWNSFWMVSDTGLHPTSPRQMQERLDAKGLTQVGFTPSPEIVTAVNTPGTANDQALRYWETYLDRGDRMAAVGGSDRHKHLLPGYPCTWVLAPANEPDAIVRGIREARTIVTSGPRAPRVVLEADGDRDGVFEATIGDTVAAARDVGFRVRVEGAREGVLRVVKRRQVIYQVAVDRDDFTFHFDEVPHSGDWYRVDVMLPVDWRLPFAAQALSPGASSVQGQLPFALSLFGISLSLSANRPLIDFDDGYLRLVNLDLGEPTLSRAAITSPIYAR